MSTRSRIGIEEKDGSITSVYCHFDGYVDGVGLALIKNFDTEEKARELIDLGDLSTVGGNLESTIAYCRDRDEEYSQSIHSSQDDYINPKRAEAIEYYYLFSNGEWMVSYNGRLPLLMVKSCLKVEKS